LPPFLVYGIKGGVLWSMQPEPYALCALCLIYSGMSGPDPTIAKLPPKVLAGHRWWENPFQQEIWEYEGV